MDQDESRYYAARSWQEAAAAIAATDILISRLHLEIAAAYAAKSREGANELDAVPDGSGASGVGEDSFRQTRQSSPI